MNEPKFSKGPWRVTKYWPRKIYGKDNRLVTVPFFKYTGDWTENCKRCEANAALIAESPNMIEFICDLISACDYGTETLSEQFRQRGLEIIRKVYRKKEKTDEQ